MANESHSDSVTSLVFASDTTPAQAMKIHAAVKRVVPDATLLARPKQRQHYGDDFGFQFVELDSVEPVQAALKNVSEARDARIASEAGSSRVNYFIDPLSFVLIVVGAIGAGFAGEIGKDLWKGVKRLSNRPRQHAEHTSPFVQLFDDLGDLHNPNTNWNPVVLLQLAPVQLTLVVEPRLPDEAVRQAEQLVLGPSRGDVNVPLRWHRDQSQWLAVGNAFLNEEALRKLSEDINRLGGASSTVAS